MPVTKNAHSGGQNFEDEFCGKSMFFVADILYTYVNYSFSLKMSN